MKPSQPRANIHTAVAFTNQRLTAIKDQLSEFESERIAIVVNGSYARLEASESSDFDYFLLVPNGMASKRLNGIKGKVRKAVELVVGKMPSEGGAFNSVVHLGELGATIGGDQDTNQNITRRILLLTEGKSVVGEEIFEAERGEVINKYVRDTISAHQLGLFLLNDIIRYYRTVCVDFEYKTSAAGKSWGIRNIKLIFSRKMLYFGGVLIVAEMAQRTYKKKIEVAKHLMKLSPIERVEQICGLSAERALTSYDYFLGELAKSNVRELLEETPEDRKSHSEYFQALKNEGHHFTMHLISALRQTYPESRPIHRSLLM